MTDSTAFDDAVQFGCIIRRCAYAIPSGCLTQYQTSASIALAEIMNHHRLDAKAVFEAVERLQPWNPADLMHGPVAGRA